MAFGGWIAGEDALVTMLSRPRTFGHRTLRAAGGSELNTVLAPSFPTSASPAEFRLWQTQLAPTSPQSKITIHVSASPNAPTCTDATTLHMKANKHGNPHSPPTRLKKCDARHSRLHDRASCERTNMNDTTQRGTPVRPGYATVQLPSLCP
ncbi:hypothetical protein VUR80DRAFT_8324 [Thermomyces stellatus]